MLAIPCVDIFHGKVVRLVKGDPGRAIEYHDDPLGAARRWEEAGAKLLHIVDLDAALGVGSSRGLIEDMVEVLRIDLQVGGGIRDEGYARSLLDRGVKRIILGSMAVREPEMVRALIASYGGERVAVALDYRKGTVVVEGWKEEVSDLGIIGALGTYLGYGVEYFLLTDVERDGMLLGPDLPLLSQACALKEARIIASGGVRDLRDLLDLEKIGAWGAILGRSLYEGGVKLEDALRALGG